MIHYSKLSYLMERHDEKHRRIPFQISFIKSSTGEIVNIPEAVCTSTFHENNTCNILILPSMQVRKLRKLSIIKFNDQEVYF